MIDFPKKIKSVFLLEIWNVIYLKLKFKNSKIRLINQLFKIKII